MSTENTKEPLEWRTERVLVKDLKFYEDNPNYMSDDKLRKLSESLDEFGYVELVAANADNTLVAGHERIKTMLARGDGNTEIEVRKPSRKMGVREFKKYLLLSNKLKGDFVGEILERAFDTEILLDSGFTSDELNWLQQVNESEQVEKAKNKLQELFLMPPFSVLDTKMGYWQDRKKAWRALGIKSEIGRGDNVLYQSETIAEPGLNHYRNKEKKKKAGGLTYHIDMQEYVKPKKAASKFAQAHPTSIDEKFGRVPQGTSIFDPVLCELMYKWFNVPRGAVLDPFAGGSVRGIVAGLLGQQYTGIDLRAEQVEANRAQWPGIAAAMQSGPVEEPAAPEYDEEPDNTPEHTPVPEGTTAVKAPSLATQPVAPNWIVGDSLEIPELLPADYRCDFVFSCPPYLDLEVYSEDPRDLSTMSHADFMALYRQIIALAVARLRDNRFACFVVGDVRDKGGFYKNFVSDTIAAFEAAGVKLYNEIILVNVIGSLAIRARKQFTSGRKVGKMHQNVLVFYKGDPSKIRENYPEVEVGEIGAQVIDEELEYED